MRYAIFSAGPWSKSGFIVKALSGVLPRANPDFESAYEKVVSWWLEIDEKNHVRRELAFDASGKTVAAAPLGTNCSIFTNLDSAPERLGTEVEASSFEQKWQEFERAWLTAKGRQIA